MIKDYVLLAIVEVVADDFNQASACPFDINHRCCACGPQIPLDVFNRDFSRCIDLDELGGYFAGVVLGDGPGGIGGEPKAAGIIEFFDGPHKR